MKLTKTKVRDLPVPTDKDQALYWDSETRGFGIRITSNGRKAWIAQARVNGKTRRITLGPVDLLPADLARRRAQAKLLEMYDGKDPQIEKRKHKAQSETLREVMEDYLRHRQTKHGPLRPASKEDIRRCIDSAFSDWADSPVTSISRDACVARFRELSQSAPVRANQCFRNLRSLLNWAREKNATADGAYPILAINPVALMFRQRLVQWNPERPRVTRIPRDKIKAVWVALAELSNPDYQTPVTCVGADLICFLLLTGCRIGEASKLKWKDVKLDSDIPTFHLTETKNHNAVTLPISTALHTVLTRRYQNKINQFVFPAIRGNAGHIQDPRGLFTKISKIAGVHLHPHALRRTFDDVAQIVGIDSDQRRQLLNHLANDVHGLSSSNNPNPEYLLSAAERISNWIIN